VCECVLSVNVCFEGCAAYVRVKRCLCMREGGSVRVCLEGRVRTCSQGFMCVFVRVQTFPQRF